MCIPVLSKLDFLVDELSNLTIIEASHLARMLREKWGITESISPVMVPADRIVDAIEKVAEKEYFDVVLKDIGPRKIEVIKTIRQLTSLGLKEAKDLAESPSAIVVSGVDKPMAEDAKQRLVDAGAVVELA